MKELRQEKRKKLKIGVILFLGIFLFSYNVYLLVKYSPHENKNTVTGQVIFTNSTLQFFSSHIQLNEYPDRIAIHYPYLLVAHPDTFQSEIYNMNMQRKEKTVKQVLLDYYNGNIVYNKQGYVTYYNTKNLGLMCDKTFLVSSIEILCVTRPNLNTDENELLAINLKTDVRKIIYDTQNTLTAIYYDNGNIYLAEYDTKTNKAFISVNGKKAPVDDYINVIYPMNNAFYVAAFKSVSNNQTESYYKINQIDNKLSTTLITKSKIIFSE